MSFMDAITSAQSGLVAAQTQLNVSANNIANFNTPGFSPSRVDSYTDSSGGVQTATQTVAGPTDLATEATNIDSARTLYDANAMVIRVANKMVGSLLDIFDDGSDPNQKSN
jgi:flagellar hook-associated protein FlgK